MKKKRISQKKKISRKKISLGVMGALIILIMIGGAINMDNDEEQGYEYNGIKFTNVNEAWQAHLDDGRKIFIMTNPAELANMTIPSIPLARMNMLSKVYISYNPEERTRIALQQFSREIKFPGLTLPACTVDVPQCAEMPLKTCNDTSTTIGVVVFEQANETNVELENNCLTIQGEYLEKVVDKLILEQL